jgi:hypothetical protein
MHASRINFKPGERFLVFLRPEAGFLRTMFDNHEWCERILSGQHRTADFPEGLSEADRIAFVRLAPGRDYDPKAYARMLQTTSLADMRDLGSLRYSASVLKGLRRHPDPGIRAGACVALASEFNGSNTCVFEDWEKYGVSLSKGTVWVTQLKGTKGKDFVLRELAGFPMEGLYSWEAKDISVELEYLAEDEDPAVRRLACRALLRNFPSLVPKACPGEHRRAPKSAMGPR